MLDTLRKKCHYSRYEKVKELIEKNKCGRYLLDIGCGRPCECMKDGSFIRYIGYGIGIDVKNCSTGFNFKLGDVTDIPFQEKTFDTITAMEVLEHIPPDKLDVALQNISRVLKDDGIFVMSTQNNSLLWKAFWLFWERTVGRMWKGSHQTRMSKKEWLGALGNYFEIIDVQYNWRIDMIIKMKKAVKEKGWFKKDR